MQDTEWQISWTPLTTEPPCLGIKTFSNKLRRKWKTSTPIFHHFRSTFFSSSSFFRDFRFPLSRSYPSFFGLTKKEKFYSFSTKKTIFLFSIFFQSLHLTLCSAVGPARIIIFLLQLFQQPFTATLGFEPMSVELHQTETFEGQSTNWSTAPLVKNCLFRLT